MLAACHAKGESELDQKIAQHIIYWAESFSSRLSSQPEWCVNLFALQGPSQLLSLCRKVSVMLILEK